MVFNIVTLPGDGIGFEIVKQGLKVLRAIERKYHHRFNVEEHLIGGAAIDAVGESLPQLTVERCKQADAVLLGAVGGPKWDQLPNGDRPEKGILGIRAQLELFANLRPVRLFEELKSASPLKSEIVGEHLDLLIVRELTSGIYFGTKQRVDGDHRSETYALDTEYYSGDEIERILHVGFQAALKRNKSVVIVDKANVMETSRLWREVATDLAKEYPEVVYSHMYVDNAAMQLIINPGQFDVMITSNMFGDILSDEASVLTGSIGMLASASLGCTKLGLYEPSHGSAPDLAGKDQANPLATILSIALMFRYSLGLEAEATEVETAVVKVLKDNYRTRDIMEEGCLLVGTEKMGDLVASQIENVQNHKKI